VIQSLPDRSDWQKPAEMALSFFSGTGSASNAKYFDIR
jgi:hypothetical protein